MTWVKPLGEVTSVETDVETKAHLPVMELRVPWHMTCHEATSTEEITLYCKENCFNKFWFLENKMYVMHYMINICSAHLIISNLVCFKYKWHWPSQERAKVEFQAALQRWHCQLFAGSPLQFADAQAPVLLSSVQVLLWWPDPRAAITAALAAVQRPPKTPCSKVKGCEWLSAGWLTAVLCLSKGTAQPGSQETATEGETGRKKGRREKSYSGVRCKRL